MTLLAVTDLSAGYGKAKVLHGVTLSVAARQIVAIVGPNGAGKTTLMHAVMGLLPRAGQVSFMGQAAGDVGWMVQRGVVLVTETRALFTDMSVEDNLELGGFSVWRQSRGRQGGRELRSSMADVFDIFPRLAERRRQSAGTLSGGERQMLALGRALMGQPKLLLLDEPSLGLAPKIVADIFRVIGTLRDRGIAILLVEQNARAALQMADHGYVLEMGRVALHGPCSVLAEDARVIETYLGRKREGAASS
ncbi:MAG: branched-chain amino acid transport system ATP-binding protein [Acetobacteraceae bacterium]|jgi:branched-chain amino acid transport system ATP-binding protein|nr:transporter ATP-binding protein [Rhodopila sp.]MEA2726850.1 branched-chain amino acid transport system ATP-binding protein [Acetobacteraceae bacterium]MEA2772314.1 branched-chain amino acid transport system ATP-binding protein [Acetobacteraceae bacterium]